MAWLFARLGLVAFFICSCAQDLPRPFYIDARFSEAEVTAILTMVNNANVVFGEALMRQPVLIYLGRYSDPDGFTIDDLSDEIHVIYKSSRSSNEFKVLAPLEPDNGNQPFRGYGTTADILIFLDRADNMDMFGATVGHELGHFLGLLHNPKPQSLMYVNGQRVVSGFTKLDQQAFCLVYSCRNPLP